MKRNNNAKEIFTNIGIGLGAVLLAGASVLCDGNSSTSTCNVNTCYNPEVKGPEAYETVMKLKNDADKLYFSEYRPVNVNVMHYINGSTTIIINNYGEQTVYNYRRGGVINDIKLPNGDVIIFRYAYSYNKLVGAQIAGLNYDFEYDYKGRITKESVGRYYKQFEYDYKGNIRRISDNRGYWREYEYNSRNQIVSESGSRMKRKIYEYDYNGNLYNIIER